LLTFDISGHNILFSKEKVRIKVYKNKIFPVVLYVCGSLSVTLIEEKAGVFYENGSVQDI